MERISDDDVGIIAVALGYGGLLHEHRPKTAFKPLVGFT
jgi:hypothetical protein